MFDLRPNYGGANEDNGDLLQKVRAGTAALSAPNPAAGQHDPCLHRRLLDTHGQVLVSLLWGYGSFLLGPGVPQVLLVPSTSLFPLSCVSSGVSLWVLCTQGMFEPSECLWQVWGLTLNMISPLLPSCWGFSFALGCGISPQSHSSAAWLFWVRGGDFQKFGHCLLSGFLWSAFKLSWHLWVCHLAYANILQ